jgi:hypothetical protein
LIVQWTRYLPIRVACDDYSPFRATTHSCNVVSVFP